MSKKILVGFLSVLGYFFFWVACITLKEAFVVEAEFSQEQRATKSQLNGCGHGCSQFNAVLWRQIRFSVAPVIVKEGRSITRTLLLQLHQTGTT